MTNMENDNGNEDRIIFRASRDQLNKIEMLMETGRYKTLSELVRQLVNIGIDKKMKE